MVGAGADAGVPDASQVPVTRPNAGDKLLRVLYLVGR